MFPCLESQVSYALCVYTKDNDDEKKRLKFLIIEKRLSTIYISVYLLNVHFYYIFLQIRMFRGGRDSITPLAIIISAKKSEKL